MLQAESEDRPNNPGFKEYPPVPIGTVQEYDPREFDEKFSFEGLKTLSREGNVAIATIPDSPARAPYVIKKTRFLGDYAGLQTEAYALSKLDTSRGIGITNPNSTEVKIGVPFAIGLTVYQVLQLRPKDQERRELKGKIISSLDATIELLHRHGVVFREIAGINFGTNTNQRTDWQDMLLKFPFNIFLKPDGEIQLTPIDLSSCIIVPTKERIETIQRELNTLQEVLVQWHNGEKDLRKLRLPYPIRNTPQDIEEVIKDQTSVLNWAVQHIDPQAYYNDKKGERQELRINTLSGIPDLQLPREIDYLYADPNGTLINILRGNVNATDSYLNRLTGERDSLLREENAQLQSVKEAITAVQVTSRLK